MNDLRLGHIIDSPSSLFSPKAIDLLQNKDQAASGSSEPCQPFVEAAIDDADNSQNDAVIAFNSMAEDVCQDSKVAPQPHYLPYRPQQDKHVETSTFLAHTPAQSPSAFL